MRSGGYLFQEMADVLHIDRLDEDLIKSDLMDLLTRIWGGICSKGYYWNLFMRCVRLAITYPFR